MGLFWTRGYRTVQTAHCAVVSIKPSQLVWGLREVCVDYESIVNLEISQPGGNGNAEAICSGAVGEVLPKSLKNCIAAPIVQLHPLSAGLETPELMNLLVCTQAGSSMYAHRNFDKNIHHKRTFTSKEVPRTLQTQSCKLSIVGLLLVVYMSTFDLFWVCQRRLTHSALCAQISWGHLLSGTGNSLTIF